MITNGDNRMRMDLAQLIKEDLARVGIECLPTGVDFNTLVTSTRDDFRYEACLLGLGSGVPADPGNLSNFFLSSGVTHQWHPRQKSPASPVEKTIDQLYGQLTQQFDVAQRRATYGKISQTLNDACVLIWLPVLELKLPVSVRFGNVHPSPMPPRIHWNVETIYQKKGTPRT